MNKKIISVLLILIIVSSMTAACGNSVPSDNAGSTDNTVTDSDKDIQAEDVQITSLEAVNKDFQEIMTIGTDLMNELSNMSSNSEYESLVKADDYVKEMKTYYADLMELCEEDEDLSGMAFQVKVLDHSCPNPISGEDSTSINNQKILYQLHLKQISSSFMYLSNYMDYLAGNSEKPDAESYFKEVPEMPTPDTVMYEIEYDSEMTDSGVKQYIYLIGDTEEDANMNYNAYIVALGVCDGISVEITSDVVYVTKDGTMVSAMMAGTDPEKGRFMVVSFQE